MTLEQDSRRSDITNQKTNRGKKKKNVKQLTFQPGTDKMEYEKDVFNFKRLKTSFSNKFQYVHIGQKKLSKLQRHPCT